MQTDLTIGTAQARFELASTIRADTPSNEEHMRKYLQFNLADHSFTSEELHGEDIVRAGRYLIAKTLVESNVATADPLGPDNPLIFSAGPFAGTSFSNANRTSVGCKSPLTGGIKEANGGGTFSYALGQQEVAGFTLNGKSDSWVIIHFKKDGEISFDPADEYLGRGNFEAGKMLHEKYGRKIAFALCGPVGEYEGLLAGIAFTDREGRPARLAARGGVGAVMGSKKVKAIVVDQAKMPNLFDRKAVLQDIKQYSQKLRDNPVIMNFFNKVGTMGMADYTNLIGGLPTNNFTSGQQVDPNVETFKMGGEYITDLNNSRDGEQTHSCMPGCVIQCSNVYADADGNEVVSPVEYETLCLLGTNCGITHPDDLAALNFIANDLGVDTIETGATLAVMMDAGLGEFGDVDFMVSALKEMKEGTENGRLWAQATSRVGEHYGVHRIPTVKKQAISAYDPRVIEVTGISMMTSAQGADHTAGNVARFKSRDKDVEVLLDASIKAQVEMATTDSLGLCIFGRVVTHTNLDFIINSINNAHGTQLEKPFFEELGRETLRLERDFNIAAGFTSADDDLPQFFYDEPLEPTNQTARFRGEDVHHIFNAIA